MVWAFNLIRERLVSPNRGAAVAQASRFTGQASQFLGFTMDAFPQQFTLHRHVVPCVWILPSSRQWVCLLGVTVEAGNLVEAIVGGEA